MPSTKACPRTKSSPVLVPPPPVIPTARSAAAAGDRPWRGPSRSNENTFLRDARREINRMVWPDRKSIYSMSLGVIGLIIVLTAGFSLMNAATDLLLKASGLFTN